MTRPHFPAVDPDTKLPSAAVQAAWQANFIDPAVASSFAAAAAGKVDENVLIFNGKKLGIKGDRLAVYTAAMTSGSAVVTTTLPGGYSFTSADIGKAVTVAGAGAAGATLRSTIASINSTTSVTLAHTASTTVSSKYLVWGTDDTANIQAAIDAMTSSSGSVRRGGELLIPKGARCMVTGTIYVRRASGAIRGAGWSDWTTGNSPLSLGSLLIWDGPSGSPMFQVETTSWFRFEHLALIGNPTADCRPSALLRFHVPDSSNLNGQFSVENCIIGRVGAYGGFAGTTTERVADVGVLLSGSNLNNDRFRYLGGRIEGCTTGFSIPNSQSVLGYIKGTTFYNNGTHIATAAQLKLEDVYFGYSAVRDLDISSSSRVDIYEFGAEFSSQLARMLGQSALVVHGGYYQLTNFLVDNSSRVIIDAVDNTRQVIRLTNLRVDEASGYGTWVAPTLVKSHASTDSALSNKLIELDNIRQEGATNHGVTPAWLDVTPVGTLESVTVFGNVQPAGGGNQNHGINQFFYNVLRSATDTVSFARDDRLVTDLPSGAVAQTFDRRQTTSPGAATSGRLALSAVYLRTGQVVTSITFASGGTALAGGTHAWAALFSPSRALLGQSANDTSPTWAANSKKTFTLASPVTIAESGWHYVGYCLVATTMPSMQNIGNNAFTNDAPAVGGWSTSGLTSTAPNPAAAPGLQPYAYARLD